MPDCTACTWAVNTDCTLGGSTQEYELSPTPTDVTTALGSDEILLDFGQDYTAQYDTSVIDCMVALWVWILTHMNQSGGGGYHLLPIRIRLIPIDIPIGKVRAKKKVSTTGSSGGG